MRRSSFFSRESATSTWKARLGKISMVAQAVEIGNDSLWTKHGSTEDTFLCDEERLTDIVRHDLGSRGGQA